MTEIKKALEEVFLAARSVGLVYLFGSRAAGDPGPLSDFDIAVYFDTSVSKNPGEDLLDLLPSISNALGTDRIDLICLNTVSNSALKYSVIKDGALIFEREPFRVIVEPEILSEYFDYQTVMRRHGLTKG